MALNYREETAAIAKLRKMVDSWREALPPAQKYDWASSYCIDVEAWLIMAEDAVTPSRRRDCLTAAWRFFQSAKRAAGLPT